MGLESVSEFESQIVGFREGRRLCIAIHGTGRYCGRATGARAIAGATSRLFQPSPASELAPARSAVVVNGVMAGFAGRLFARHAGGLTKARGVPCPFYHLCRGQANRSKPYDSRVIPLVTGMEEPGTFSIPHHRHPCNVQRLPAETPHTPMLCIGVHAFWGRFSHRCVRVHSRPLHTLSRQTPENKILLDGYIFGTCATVWLPGVGYIGFLLPRQNRVICMGSVWNAVRQNTRVS